MASGKHERRGSSGKRSRWYYIKKAIPFFVLSLYPFWFGLAAHSGRFIAIGMLCVLIGVFKLSYPKLKEFFAPLENKEQHGEYDYVYRASTYINKKIDDLKKQ